MPKTRRSLSDWEKWIRPFVVRRKIRVRDSEQFCYSVERLPIKLMIEHGMSRYLKWRVFGKCEGCGSNFEQLWSNYCQRKRTFGLVICGKCACKKAVRSEGWRKANSCAQRKAQGSFEARANMSRILKNVHRKRPSIRKKISESLKKRYKKDPEFRKKVSAASKRSWKSLEYQEKVTGNGYHHGYFLGSLKRIYFASSWELMFLLWCNRNSDVEEFGRCEDCIPYKRPSGRKAVYHPDFYVVWRSGRKDVIEIKGGFTNIDLVERKRLGAVEFYKGKNQCYRILFKEDLISLGILRQNRVLDWLVELHRNGVIDYQGSKGKKFVQIIRIPVLRIPVLRIPVLAC